MVIIAIRRYVTGLTMQLLQSWNCVESIVKMTVNNIHTYIYTHIHTYIHTHIHTYIHTYIHAYMYTYVHTSVSA